MANTLSAAAQFKSSSQPNEECRIGFETALLAFSSMTIYGLASCEGKQVPCVLHRSTSFPSRRTTTVCKVMCDEIEGWDSMPLPVEKPHLELELGECLGDGRIGFVYVARVVAVLNRPDGAPVSNPPLELSTELVVKFVRPTNCRSLARETWFYEHLPEAEGFQGAVVPLCYGFFTASTTPVQPRKPASLEIRPWIGPYGEHVPLDFSEGQRKYGDELPDEYPCGMYSDDARTCRTESPWCEWRPDPENPLLGVLVLEKLGETYSCDVYDTDQKSRKDVADLIDDLSAAGIKHHDFKCNNVARALAHVVCPRHGYAHGWRIIDFDRSERWGKTMAFDEEYFLPINRMEYIEDNYNDFPGSFWTSIAY
ncbi:hypothetical protein Hypma_006392 [Hypsizygus marmoreus]|uniref:Protein kinase domain-containing protein n=1 Tax=Hypsizygus marmoreus TaxID=39966 RepID=A0A369JXF8_HYPMA|nr:hypothetical protein Hypma_006392 [Hypsizygus marmoreus]